jgi:hypothetical protein
MATNRLDRELETRTKTTRKNGVDATYCVA